MVKKIHWLIVLFIFIVLVGFILIRNNSNKIITSNSSNIINQQNECGGWDTSGEVICECAGNLIKPTCSAGSVCDSQSYYCDGVCGKCCYKGVSENSKYPKCP